MLTAERKERIKSGIRRFAESSSAQSAEKELFVTAADDIVDEISDLENRKTSNAEVYGLRFYNSGFFNHLFQLY